MNSMQHGEESYTKIQCVYRIPHAAGNLDTDRGNEVVLEKERNHTQCK